MLEVEKRFPRPNEREIAVFSAGYRFRRSAPETTDFQESGSG